MKNSIKAALAVGLATALGAGGFGLVANAKGNVPAASETRIAQATDTEVNEGPEDEAKEGTEDEAQDAQEMAQYKSLAKITPQQAQKAAEASQGGTATKVELDEEDGSLVYEVKVGKAEVLVDAGNGKVLKTEAKGQEENDAAEAKIRGSIQVPDTDGEQSESER